MIKKFKNKHIDLTKIVAISDVYMDYVHYNSNAYTMKVDIDIQLLDKPIEFIDFPIGKWNSVNEHEIEVKYIENDIPVYKHTDGEFKVYTSDKSKLVCVDRFQKEVDQLIEDWKKAIGQ